VKSANPALAVPLASGCAQQSQEYAMAQGLRTVTNLRLLQTGALAKRPGAKGLAGTTSSSRIYIKGNGTSTYVESPAFASTVNGAPLLGTTSGEAFVMDEVQGTLFEAAGAYGTAVPVRKRRAFASIVGSATGDTPAAVAVNSSGYVMIATLYEGVLTMAIESPSGARIFQLTEYVTTQVRCHAVGARLFLVYQDGTDIIARVYQPSSTDEGFVTSATLNTLFDATYYWDTSAYDGTHWFLIHGTSSDDLQITKFATTSAAATTSFATSAIAATPCSIWADSASGNVWVGYHDDPAGAGAVTYRVYAASDLSSVKGATVLNNSTLYGPPLFGPRRNYFSKTQESSSAFYVYRYAETSGKTLRATLAGHAYSTATSGGELASYGILPISKPDSRQRVWCITDNGTDNFAVARVALLRFYQETRDPPAIDLALPAMIAPGATEGPVNDVMYFHAPAVGSSSSFVVMPRVLTVLDGTPFTTVEVIEYATAEQAPWRSVRPGSPSTAVGGSPVEFFGISYGKGHILPTSNTDLPNFAGASEIGFLNGPTITGIVVLGAGSFAAGTYSYRAVYEWDDTYGRRHRSEPSAPVSVTLDGTTAGTRVSITTLDISQRRSESATQNAVRVAVYRTLNGGTNYQRVFDASPSIGTGYIEFDDTDPDADAADEEFIYTDGGVLENNLAPSCRYLARSEDRLWFGGLFTGNIIQASKVIIPEEPIQCTDHPSHQIVLPGECTGLAYMDGQVVAFTRDTILLVNSSSGPNDQGVGEFAPPRLHTTGIGCVDGRSVLETPEGVFFLSQRGIELLPRGAGPVQFIGAAVKDLIQTSLLDQCGFSAYQADKNGSYARFGLMTGSTEFSVPSVRYVATLDLATGQWFIDDYGSETMGAMGAWPNGFALIRTDLDSDTSPTPIWYEDGSLVSQPETGGAAYIDSSIICNRFWPFGQTGWGHVRRVMVAFYSNAANWRLALTVQTDANTVQSVTWDITSTGLQWRELVVVEQKCTTVKVTVSDTDYSSNGAKQGPTYLSIGIDAEPYEGLRLLTGNGDRQ
jgi:hypothetical protein